MNTNLRALTFGIAGAVALTITLDVMSAASLEVVRLDPVVVTAHRANFDADGNVNAAPEVVRLAPVVVTARHTSFAPLATRKVAHGASRVARLCEPAATHRTA